MCSCLYQREPYLWSMCTYPLKPKIKNLQFQEHTFQAMNVRLNTWQKVINRITINKYTCLNSIYKFCFTINGHRWHTHSSHKCIYILQKLQKQISYPSSDWLLSHYKFGSECQSNFVSEAHSFIQIFSLILKSPWYQEVWLLLTILFKC